MSQANPNLFVITAPSGAGKTTLVKALLERDPSFEFSVSYTTREKRKTEIEGRDYFFVNEIEFLRLKNENQLLESAFVFGNYYGTSRNQVQQLLNTNKHVILEIDWQGAQQVRESMPDCISIFVLPSSKVGLERRLRERRTDSEEVITQRLNAARTDMAHWNEFDFVIINDDLDIAVTEFASIVTGHGETNASDNPILQEKIAEIVS